ncbi:glycosyltransferase [Methylomonas sp. SURF-2]|uniref:Glycosyltransferase n=1 Tax=Methylomonas subterranea TaxID=2952225 RepID=A0ABT1TJ38_9GAMM|nr:glycosyltransferase family 2 protein [Methylomonas sp. SURF-2]MCQ8105487.1 glycosyltransferase [Methylomonas sp. SURF-2]
METAERPPKTIALDSRYSTARHLNTLRPPLLTNSPDNKIQFSLFSTSNAPEKIDGGLRCSGYFKYNLPDHPLITVVTVVYNGEKYLEQTIQSVINQSYDAVEYIVIDGGSTDGTLDIIRQYDALIDYWVSESDKGIADAMNKGVSFATGEYIVFINSDDFLYNVNSLEVAASFLDNNYMIFSFDILYGSNLVRLSSRGFNFWLNFRNGILHQGVVCSRLLFNMVGYFDEQLEISMDYDFFLRAYYNRFKLKKIKTVLSVMRDTGLSSQKDWQSLVLRFNEDKLVQHRMIQNSNTKVFNKFFWFFYMPYRKIKFLFAERFGK